MVTAKIREKRNEPINENGNKSNIYRRKVKQLK